MAYRAMSVFLSAMMVFSTVILPLNTVDAHSPIIGRSNTIDVDNDGFEDSQDACLNSTQNWTVYSNYFDIVNYTSNAMEIVGGFDFAIDSQDRLHIVRVQDGYGTGEWYVNYSRYSINETSLNLEYSDLLAGYGVEFGNYLSMVLDSNDSPKIIFTSQPSCLRFLGLADFEFCRMEWFILACFKFWYSCARNGLGKLWVSCRHGNQ